MSVGKKHFEREINLSEIGIGRNQAAKLRAKFNAIKDDWNLPEMNIYDIDCRELTKNKKQKTNDKS